MAKVYISTVIAAPAGAVWQVMRNFNALPEWTPFAAESRIKLNMLADRVGCIRNFRLKDGARIREQLLALPDRDHRRLGAPPPSLNCSASCAEPISN